VPIDHIRHALQASDHRHGLQAIVLLATVHHALPVIAHSRGHAQPAIAHLATVHHALPVIAHSAIGHRVLPVIAPLAELLAVHRVLARWVVRVDLVVQAVVGSIVVLSAVASAVQYLGAVAATRDNAGTALTAKEQSADLTPPRAMVRDGAKAAKAANQAR
jgi:hypothetical protein